MRKMLAVTAAGLVCAGAAGVWGVRSQAEAVTASGPGPAPSVTPVPALSVPASPTAKPTPVKAAPVKTTPIKTTPIKTTSAAGRPKVLSGTRTTTIMRTRAFESGVSLDGGQLTERDDDSGRQRFVPTPVGRNTYLIKAYGTFRKDPATLEPSCWQVRNEHSTAPLTVEAGACDTSNPLQRFTITKRSSNAYAISHDSAFLQYSPQRGLILEELGDAELRDVYRFTDSGSAPRDTASS